jgi:hypothetical protein
MSPVKVGVTKNFFTAPRAQNKNYGFSFNGYIQVMRAGTYKFFTASDDGSRLYINNTLVVENGGVHRLRERVGSIILPVGYHAIRVDYFQASSTAGLRVMYQGPALSKRTVPNNVLFYR